MATAANYYLRAAFFSDLGKKLFSNLALREVSISETGSTCLQVAANTNTYPCEGVHYFTTIFQQAEHTENPRMGTFTKPQCTAHSSVTPCTRIGLSQIVGLPPTPCTRIVKWELILGRLCFYG